MMQTQRVTTSMGHAATNFFGGNPVFSLQPPIPDHMPQFLQWSRTIKRTQNVKYQIQDHQDSSTSDSHAEIFKNSQERTFKIYS